MEKHQPPALEEAATEHYRNLTLQERIQISEKENIDLDKLVSRNGMKVAGFRKPLQNRFASKLKIKLK